MAAPTPYNQAELISSSPKKINVGLKAMFAAPSYSNKEPERASRIFRDQALRLLRDDQPDH